jgi:hypothetical protein
MKFNDYFNPNGKNFVSIGTKSSIHSTPNSARRKTRDGRQLVHEMDTLSSKNSWAVTDILARGKAFILCEALVDVKYLVSGSNIRRVGNRGLKKWEREWDKGLGFDNNECFMRVYVEKDQVDTLQPLIDAITKKHKEANITIPSTGVNLGTIDIKTMFGEVKVIDGMHRASSLVKADVKWVKKAGKKPGESPFLYVRVIFYHPDVKRMMAVLAKASNDQKQVHVKEDGLERITLTHQIIISYGKQHPNTKPKTCDLAKYYMDQVGIVVKDKQSAVNYHCQLVTMAQSVEGEVTVWLTKKLQDLEARGGSRAEVCMCVVGGVCGCGHDVFPPFVSPLYAPRVITRRHS